MPRQKTTHDCDCEDCLTACCDHFEAILMAETVEALT